MKISTRLLTLCGALVLGFAGAALWQVSGLGTPRTEQLVHDYLMEHPEVLPKAIERLQSREMQARIDPVRGAVETPYPGAVIGNPDGAITLVEFTDYACPYCSQSKQDVDALIAANPDLKVVIREYPILTPQSADAARMALAAADQGRYTAFHTAMFDAGRPNDTTILAAAKLAGMDLAKAREAIASGKYDTELANNAQLVQAIGFSGTPAFVIGREQFGGAVGVKALTEAIERTRGS